MTRVTHVNVVRAESTKENVWKVQNIRIYPPYFVCFDIILYNLVIWVELVIFKELIKEAYMFFFFAQYFFIQHNLILTFFRIAYIMY